MQPEIWKDIPGYEGRYQASTEGRIRSVDHYVRVVPASGTEAKRMVKGRVLRPGSNRSGHLSVVLRHGANSSQVHQLVALTFLGNCPEGMEVCHNDGDPTNNSVENLRYDTRRNNILDVYRQGKRWRRLNLEEVVQIKRLIASCDTNTEIARIYDVSQSAISNIRCGKTYEWVTNDENTSL